MGELSESEKEQLLQTIEMFEVITQSQPTDYQSLEILKEAYQKLELEEKVVDTSKRIANAYVQLGQLSSAILEYESILQRYPDDQEVQDALGEIENQATGYTDDTATAEAEDDSRPKIVNELSPAASIEEVDDGKSRMRQTLINAHLVAESDFDKLWATSDPNTAPDSVTEPFLQVASDRLGIQMPDLLKAVCEASRCSFLPIAQYDVDIELARSFPRETCQRWCVLPIDRLSKTVLMATANPFNKQAVKEIEQAVPNRLLWYVTTPGDLKNIIEKLIK